MRNEDQVAKVAELAKWIAATIFFMLFYALTFGAHAQANSSVYACRSPRITDGHTFRCGGMRVRLYGIDAPELPGHCRRGRRCTPGDPYASTRNLSALLARGNVICRTVDRDRYGRTVARCGARGVDLSCRQVAGGFAVPRYGRLDCQSDARLTRRLWPRRADLHRNRYSKPVETTIFQL